MSDNRQSTNRVLYAALLANFAILIAKFCAACYTGSAAMFSEAVHSGVDMGNGGLLLFGVRMSQKVRDSEHPFGYGRELYFWSLIVALAVFALGGGASIFEGIQRILRPHALEHVVLTYWIFGISALFEGSSLLIAVIEFTKLHSGSGLVRAIRQSKDPASFTVLFKDSAAVAGITIAATATGLMQVTHFLWIDGIASILIGILLMSIAFLLAGKTKALLIGEGLSQRDLRGITELVRAEAIVTSCGYPFTTFFGPQEAMLALSVQFKPGTSNTDIEYCVDRLEDVIRHRHPELVNIFLGESRLPHLALINERLS